MNRRHLFKLLFGGVTAAVAGFKLAKPIQKPSWTTANNWLAALVTANKEAIKCLPHGQVIYTTKLNTRFWSDEFGCWIHCPTYYIYDTTDNTFTLIDEQPT